MNSPSAPGDSRQALAAGVACYVIWGLVPLVFQVIGHRGVAPWEILAHRTIWAVPTALLFVWLARQGGQVVGVLRNGRTLSWLALSALLIAVNWVTFIWAVNSGRVLETSLGYYLNPLLNMAAGALLFRERIDRVGRTAIAMAAAGVALQALALGRLPWVSLVLAVTFCAYGVVRKRVAADAQTGLLVECLFLAVPSLAFVIWQQQAGSSHGGDPATLALLIACGPLTAAPLALFAWAARRLPLSAMGFLQFIAPSMTFVMGVTQGEPFTPLRGLSFVFIWAGAAVFLYGAWRRSREVTRALSQSRAAE